MINFTKMHGLGNDYVFVERGGGVIPKVVGVDYSKQ